MSESDVKIIRQALLGLLSRREHSARELFEKLKLKGFAPELISEQIDYCQERGWQSDSRYAESKLRAGFSKGQGPNRIRAELHQQGVKSDIVESAFTECEQDWFERARQVAVNKYRSPSSDFKEQQKRMRFLQYRGFDNEQIRYALSFDD